MTEQRTIEWHNERLGKVTASRIVDVMMKPTTAGYQNYHAQLVCERLTGEPTETFQSAAMLHGTETEPQARAMYELAMGVDVQEVGFIPHPTLSMSGASPDGLVGADALVEIKCPQPATHIKTLSGANIDRKYILQMHWQMICTGRTVCDFVSFSPALPPEMQLFVQAVPLDPELSEQITEAVTQFLAKVDETVVNLNREYKKEAA
ncbi:lambda exonuclease family protein [Ruegeria jejuensis]|uniref:lambda exonuclease family protein n=1 Tax=Ruegeria jejuensis TaxID=3233338 RepID=UPI00355C678D